MNLKINKLKVAASGKEILKGVDLVVKACEVHVVMGPNGSGKSTLAQVIAGSPFYKIVDGLLSIDGKDINKLSPDKRAKLGIFLGFQNPIEIPGVSVFNVVRKANQSLMGLVGRKALVLGRSRTRVQTSPAGRAKGPWLAANGEATPLQASSPRFNPSVFRQQLLEYASSLKLSSDHLSRSFNEGFSGGEKKRNEILQMLALSPKLVILDEIDSGLDVDGLKLVATAVKKFTIDNPRSSIILITHYARILKYIKADFVHVMNDGKIVKSGKANLASEIEEKGYEAFATVIARNEVTKQSILSS